jgi:Ca2+-binding RTX toxin-like protein
MTSSGTTRDARRGTFRAVAALTSGVLAAGMLFTGISSAVAPAVAPVGAGFTVTPGDLAFIYKQIEIADEHATTATPQNPCGTLLAQPGDNIPDAKQVPDILTPYGLRTVDGSCNNLKNAATTTTINGPAAFGSSRQLFPRLTTPVFRGADAITPQFPVGAPGPTSYAQTRGNVVDAQPRLISNLIDDQTANNPAAVAAATHSTDIVHPGPTAVPCTTDPSGGQPGVPAGCTPTNETLFIPNVSTNNGLAPPYNSLFTFFGQFFDHGLDQTVTGGQDAVFVPLSPDDPLVTVGPDGQPNTGDEVPPQMAFMVLTRALNQPGPDGKLGTADDVRAAVNNDTPWVDQSQSYGSTGTQDVFLREFVPGDSATAAFGPSNPAAVTDGNLLHGIVDDDPLPCQKPSPFECYNDGPAGADSLSTWAAVRQQAHDVLGLRLEDRDVNNIPMIATDPYGKYIPGPHGLPQYVTTSGQLVEGRLDDPSTPGTDETVPVPANVVHLGIPFIADKAVNSDPAMQDTNGDGQPDTIPVPDPDSDVQTDFTKQVPGTYDDELLADHFVCGDPRCNENIALSTMHLVFHSEHNNLVNQIKQVLQGDTSPSGVQALHDWMTPDPALGNGTGGYDFGERLFQAARFINEMEYQHLVFEQFARKVQPAIHAFTAYQPNVDPDIETEFAAAVYRFGHSMLDDDVARLTVDPATGKRTNDSLPLLDAFTDPPAFFQSKTGTFQDARQAAGSVIMGSSDQTGNEIDEFVTNTLRDNLLGLPLDLAAINIARGREMGVPPLNDFRRQLFAQTNDPALKPYASWADFGQHLKHPESLVNFVAAYGTHPSIVGAQTAAAKRLAARAIVAPQAGDVPPADASDFLFGTGSWADKETGLNSVDLWVGGLAEAINQNGGMLGNTFNYVFQTQMEKLQDGDRFYYLARTAGLNLLSQLEADTFAEFFERNTEGTSNLKADAFATADCKFDLDNINGPAASGTFTGAGSVNDDPASSCNENKLLLQQPDGTIQYRQENPVDPKGINGQAVYYGTSGVDKVVGGTDDDTMWGNAGNDRLEGSNGNDTIFGGTGDDIITDTSGLDILQGGPGDDAVAGGPDFDSLLGNDGQDVMDGGPGDNEEFGGPGNDFILAGDGADAAQGDGGDDWLEGGTNSDALIGDHGAPFLDDPGEVHPGNDILIGQSGDNTYNSEGGDDVMEQGPGIDKNSGAAGFDWAAHQFDSTPVNDDLMINNFQGGLPIQVLVNRDRWQEVEADSGGTGNDVIKGNDATMATPRLLGGGGFIGCDALDADSLSRISGLADLLPPVSAWPGTAADVAAISAAGRCPLSGNVWGEGDILIGGPGDDSFTGRGGDDIIDGDKQLKIAISVRTDPSDPSTEIGRTDLLEDPATSGSFGPGTTGMTLRQAVFAGKVDPADLVPVREIVDDVTAPADCASAHPVNCDTAVYVGPRSQYTVQGNPDGSVTVTDVTNGSTVPGAPAGGDDSGPTVTPDGTDTLFHVEQLQFADGTVDMTVPTSVTAFAEDSEAIVNWSAPVSLGRPITGFAIDVISGGAVVTTVSNVPADATSFDVGGLDNGSTYSFIVRALTADGVGPDSTPSNPVVPAPVPPRASAPGQPAIVGPPVPGDSSAVVSWSPPTSDGGATITGYVVGVLPPGATTPVRTVLVPAPSGTPTTVSTTISGLTNGTAYRFNVMARNAASLTGDPSQFSPAVTPFGKAFAPVLTSAVAGKSSATVEWTAPTNDNGSPITGYAVQVFDALGHFVGSAHHAAATQRSITLTLHSGAGYHFTVAATNAAGVGTPSQESVSVTPYTVSRAPFIGSVTSGDSAATVQWAAPLNTGSTPITGYRIRVIDARTDVQVGQLRIAGPDATSAIVTGLHNGVAYRFQVAAVNKAGESGFSGASARVVPATTPHAPGAPHASAGRAGGAITATVSWQAPGRTGGAAITGYVVWALRVSATGRVLSTTVQEVKAASPHSVTMSLVRGSYRFTVQAMNRLGVSPQSGRSNKVVAR